MARGVDVGQVGLSREEHLQEQEQEQEPFVVTAKHESIVTANPAADLGTSGPTVTSPVVLPATRGPSPPVPLLTDCQDCHSDRVSSHWALLYWLLIAYPLGHTQQKLNARTKRNWA